MPNSPEFQKFFKKALIITVVATAVIGLLIAFSKEVNITQILAMGALFLLVAAIWLPLRKWLIKKTAEKKRDISASIDYSEGSSQSSNLDKANTSPEENQSPNVTEEDIWQ